MEGTLELDGRNHLTFVDGSIHADTLIGSDDHRAHWRAVGGSDLRWVNMHVTGPRTPFDPYDGAYGHQHGFDFQGVAGFRLSGCVVQAVKGDGICCELNPATMTWTSDGIVDADCRILGTGRQSITFTGARRITVGAIAIEDPSLSILDIEPNGVGWGAEDIVCDGFRVSNTNPAHTYSLLYVADFGGAGSTVKRITIRNTVQTGNSIAVVTVAPVGDRYEDFTITNNTSDTTFAAYMDIRGVDGFTITGNDVALVNLVLTDCS